MVLIKKVGPYFRYALKLTERSVHYIIFPQIHQIFLIKTQLQKKKGLLEKDENCH